MTQNKKTKGTKTEGGSITTGRRKKVVGRLKQQNPGREINWQNGAPYFTDTTPHQRIELN